MKYRNPIIKGYADPDVLLYEGVYYMYATSSHITDGYEVYSSTDLVNWENHGNCLPKEPWGLKRWFWAPDVKEHNGKFYMLASIDEHLGMLVADSPLGPFVPQDGFLFDHSIDGHILFEDGQMYIYYVSWREGHKYAIWGCKMKDDYITPDLTTEKMLIVADQPYESFMAKVAEAPYMMKKDGKYFLTYSGCHYQSPFYCVAYAESDSPLGDYVKYENNPILVADGVEVSGAGHHCITTNKDGSEYFIIYHTHDSPTKIHPRNLSLGKIWFDTENGKTVLKCCKADSGQEELDVEV